MGKTEEIPFDITQEENKRFALIDNLYTYGMFLVVLGHVRLSPADETTYLYHWIYGFHMALFFWIAGFLSYPIKNNSFKYFDFKAFVLKKLKGF